MAWSRRRSAARSRSPAARSLHLFDAESGRRVVHGLEPAAAWRRDLIVGIDAGTSVIKALAFDLRRPAAGDDGRAQPLCDPARGGVEQDMARTWRDTAAVLRRAGRRGRRPGAAQRGARDHRPGRRHLADRRRRRAGGAGLAVARFARRRPRRGARGRRHRRAHLPPHRLRPERLQPERPAGLAGRATGRRCWRAPPPPATARTGSISTSLASAPPTRPRASSPSAISARRAYAPEILDALGIAELARLLPPMIDGAARASATPAAAAAVGLPAGTPVCWAASTSSAPALGGGLYEPGARARLLDHRLDRHAHADRARRRRRHAERGLHRLHHGAPAAGHLAPRCNRTWLRR